MARHLGREPKVSDLRDDTIARIMEEAIEEGLSPISANAIHGAALALARYAASHDDPKTRRRYLDAPLDLKPMACYQREPTAWTIDQLSTLLQACAATPGEVSGIPAGRYWVAVVLVHYDTGFRSGAVWAMRREHVDLDRGTVTARAETQKTRRDETRTLARDTVAALKRIWLPERVPLFPWPLSARSRYAHFHAIVLRAGLSCTRRDKFHKLRRTSATMAELAIGPGAGQRHLGHSTGAITSRHYIDPTFFQAADVASRIPRPKLRSPKRKKRT